MLPKKEKKFKLKAKASSKPVTSQINKRAPIGAKLKQNKKKQKKTNEL